MSVFYQNVSKKHLERLVEEREYYLASMKASDSDVSKEAYKLMADFYSTLIKAAEKHIAEHS